MVEEEEEVLGCTYACGLSVPALCTALMLDHSASMSWRPQDKLPSNHVDVTHVKELAGLPMPSHGALVM